MLKVSLLVTSWHKFIHSWGSSLPPIEQNSILIFVFPIQLLDSTLWSGRGTSENNFEKVWDPFHSKEYKKGKINNYAAILTIAYPNLNENISKNFCYISFVNISSALKLLISCLFQIQHHHHICICNHIFSSIPKYPPRFRIWIFYSHFTL